MSTVNQIYAPVISIAPTKKTTAFLYKLRDLLRFPRFTSNIRNNVSKADTQNKTNIIRVNIVTVIASNAHGYDDKLAKKSHNKSNPVVPPVKPVGK